MINVDKVKEIPIDYPGAMGVPITYLDCHDKDRFEILDIRGHLRMVNGREPYQRVIIRNLKPDLPEVIDLVEWFLLMGAPMDVVDMNSVDMLPEDFTREYRAQKDEERRTVK